MEKCVGCQHYDRNEAQADEKGVRWGKCRRAVPIVHPLATKAYMVEGIWPHVRDDDWCGEWTASKRGVDLRANEVMTSLLMPPPNAPARTPPLGSTSLLTPAVTAPESPPMPIAGRFGSD